jgi:hypothetical protein
MCIEMEFKSKLIQPTYDSSLDSRQRLKVLSIEMDPVESRLI